MTSPIVEALQQLDGLLAGVCASAEISLQFDVLRNEEHVDVLQVAGRIQRRLDAVITTVAGQVKDRDMGLAAERVSPAAGCRDVTELLRRTLRVDTGTARRYVRAADAVHQDLDLSSGALLPARFDALREALRAGELSVTGLLAAVSPIERPGTRISPAERDVADRMLADCARGLDLTDDAGRPGPAPTTEELGAYAQALALALDPDGKEPEDARANRNRGLTLGREQDGLVPLRGGLLPDVAAQLQRLLDALLNPNVHDPEVGHAEEESDAAREQTSFAGVAFSPEDGDATDPEDFPDPDDLPDPVDPRTPAQKRHDAFAAILTATAGTGRFPTLGGAAPTLVMSVSGEDYAAGTGRAFLEGTGWDVPIGVAHQTACAGGIQRVLFDERGQIVSIGTSARIFTAIQRRAIILRDRECLIPGCHTPATWCEIHHVREWAGGGPTHTSNGVALCWHHHRTLDTSGWQIRMNHGTPEIRGPHWWDPSGDWHRPRTRLRARRELAGALGPPGS